MIRRATLTLLALVTLGLLGGCAAPLPSLEGRVASSALTDTSGTRLGRALAAGLAAHPGKSGIHALPNPRDAFAVRAVLAAAADKSLDVQYYIWHGDPAGTLLFEALWQAAERGVRVRLLLDDNNTAGLDPTLAALDAHPNIELRLYNPFVQRGARGLGYVFDFSRLNRRMHNKSFTVDNQVTVVGGRNIGDEYFGVGNGMVFADLDVAAVGPVVAEVSKQFDLYWNSASAYAAAGLLDAPGPQAAAELQARFAAARTDPQAVAYLEAVRTTPVVRDLLARTLSFEWARAQLATFWRKKPHPLPPEQRSVGGCIPATTYSICSPWPLTSACRWHTLTIMVSKDGLIAELGQLAGSMVPGSLSEVTRQCGDSSCACARDPTRRHGPHLYLKFSAQGKAHCVYVPPDHASALRESHQAWLRFQQLGAELGAANRERFLRSLDRDKRLMRARRAKARGKTSR